MARANPSSFCTKWVEESDAMSDQLHQLEDTIASAKKARDRYLAVHPEVRRRLERIRDSVPIARSNAPFSLFADTSRDPK
jgi:hypothetical protein